MGALDALDQKTAESFKERLAGEVKRLAAPTGDVAFKPEVLSFDTLDQLLADIKKSVAAVQSVDLRAHLRTLDSATKLVKELYQKAWSADQMGRYEGLTAQRQELQFLKQNAHRNDDEAGVRAIELLMVAFDQLDLLRQRFHDYYSKYEERLAARKKELAQPKEGIPLMQPVQPKPAVVPVPQLQPKPAAQPAPQKAVPQKPNIFQQGAQWLGQQIFDDSEAQGWYDYSFNEIPRVAEAVFVTSKLPVSAVHFNVWNERVHTVRLFVLRKAPDLGTKGYLGFMGDTDDILKKMYVRKRESFTAQDAALLMKRIEAIAKKRKELAALIKAVRDDAWSSRYNRYGAELIDLVLAMHQYGAEVLRQEILSAMQKQQAPKTETSWKTKIQRFFGL